MIIVRSGRDELAPGAVANSVVTPSGGEDEARWCHPFRHGGREGPRLRSTSRRRRIHGHNRTLLSLPQQVLIAPWAAVRSSRAQTTCHQGIVHMPRRRGATDRWCDGSSAKAEVPALVPCNKF